MTIRGSQLLFVGTPQRFYLYALPMARAIESLVASAERAIDTLQAHAAGTRALETEARARLDRLPAPADDDAPGLVKQRASLRVVTRMLKSRLRDTLSALTNTRAVVDRGLVAHHRYTTSDTETGRNDADAEVRAAQLVFDEIYQDAMDDGLFATLPKLPNFISDDGNQRPPTVPDLCVSEPPVSSHSLDDLWTNLDELSGVFTGSEESKKRLVSSRAALADVIAFLKKAERDVDVSAALAAEIKQLACSAGSVSDIGKDTESDTETTKQDKHSQYTPENFAYGTTSLRAWLAVVASCPALLGVLKELARDVASKSEKETPRDECNSNLSRLENLPRSAVFGSSIGWLVFYLSLGQRVRCVGYELLKGRVAIAESAAAAIGKNGSQETFSNLFAFGVKDATSANLTDVKLVVLTSQCWDQSLKTQIAEHLQKNLPTNALVVDYCDFLSRYQTAFASVGRVAAPTSWNEKQNFFVFQKKEEQVPGSGLLSCVD
jgi:hypothetical protein